MSEGPEMRERAAEAALWDEAARLRSPVDAVVVTAADGTVTAASRSLATVVGLAPAELRGGTLVDHVHPDDAAALLRLATDADRADAEPVVVRLRHGNGSWRAYECLAGPAGRTSDGTTAVVLRDVSTVEALRRARRVVEARSRAFAERGGDLVAVVERDGRLREVSAGSARILGRTPESLRGRAVVDLLHPDDRPKAVDLLSSDPTHQGWGSSVDLRFRHRDGSWRVLEVEVEDRFDDETVGAAVVAARDVTEHRHVGTLLERQQEVLRALAGRDPGGRALDAIARLVSGPVEPGRAAVLVHRGDGTLRLVSAPGVPDGWVRGAGNLAAPAALPPTDAVRPFEGEAAELAVAHGLGLGWSRVVVDGRDGRPLGEIVLFTGSKRFATAAEHGALDVAATLAAVVLGRLEDERRLEQALDRDPLTGLAPRERFHDALLDRCRRGESLMVTVVDIDDFAALNAAVGYGAGDLVLRTLAQRLAATVRARDLAARLGDDELAVVGGTSDLESARRFADRLHEALRAPIAVRGDRVPIRLSIGVALGGRSPDPDVVLARAERALARARAAGGDVVVVDRDPTARAVRPREAPLGREA